MSNKKDMPVYLFTGFLEAGKTKFIQETLEDKRFCRGEKTLLLICEEGEEEYEPDQFADSSVYMRVVESKEQLSSGQLSAWAAETGAERVLVEYNGMWLLDELYAAMPQGWVVYQEFLFVDAGSFLSYNSNMRQLVYDKLKSCELVVFNRFRDDMDKMQFHKIVRGASRRTDIAYEYADGKVVYDDIEDPLPFDVEAPVINVGDNDYALWYRDMGEEVKKYDGKTVCFKCKTLVRKKIPAGHVIVGRHIMTCCQDDIQFAGLVCRWDKDVPVKDESWIKLTANIEFRFHPAYTGKGPVLTLISMENCDQPDQPVATFY